MKTLGQMLHRYMGWPGPVTWRQHLTWTAWLEEQWNVHDKADFNFARLAMEVRRLPFAVWGKSLSVELKDFLLRFSTTGQRELTDEEQAAADELSKMRWRAVFGRSRAAAGGSSGTPEPQP